MDERIDAMKAFAKKAIDLGFDNTAFIKTADIIFSEELRATCEENTCGHYGTNWMCPPGIGAAKDCINKVKAFENGMLLQYFVQMKNPFDWKAMQEGAVHIKEMLGKFKREMSLGYEYRFLVLGAGGCQRCAECAYKQDEPCRFPNDSFSSVEAHGIYVSDIMKKAGLSYKNGDNSIAYVGMVLF